MRPCSAYARLCCVSLLCAVRSKFACIVAAGTSQLLARCCDATHRGGSIVGTFAAGQLVQGSPDVFTPTPSRPFPCRLFCKPLNTQHLSARGQVQDVVLTPTSLSASSVCSATNGAVAACAAQPGTICSRRYQHSADSKRLLRVADASLAVCSSQVLVWGRRACKPAAPSQLQPQCVLTAALPVQEPGATLQMSAVHCAAFTCQVRPGSAYFVVACAVCILNYKQLQVGLRSICAL